MDRSSSGQDSGARPKVASRFRRRSNEIRAIMRKGVNPYGNNDHGGMHQLRGL